MNKDDDPEAIQKAMARMLAEAQRREETGKLSPPQSQADDTRDIIKRVRRVPEMHIRAIFDKEPMPCDALDRVARFLGDRTKLFLVLAGGYGTMRSGSACWALTQRGGLFVMADEICELAMETKPDLKELYYSLRTAPLLIVDDVGTEFDDKTGLFVSKLHSILNARYQNVVKTIITTNLEPDAFGTRYGHRILDRMRDPYGSYVGIGGESVRGK